MCINLQIPKTVNFNKRELRVRTHFLHFQGISIVDDEILTRHQVNKTPSLGEMNSFPAKFWNVFRNRK